MTHLNRRPGPKNWLEQDSVHLWSISFSEQIPFLDELFDLLSVDERERAARFHFEKDRNQFIIARGFLRKILSGYLEKHAHTLEFIYERNGKPQLAAHSKIRFSLSHAGDLAVYAVAWGRDVGIDLEPIRFLPDLDLVTQRFFFQEELNHLKAFQGAEKEREFYRLWTRGEALLKWCGQGITEPEDRKTLAREFLGTMVEFIPAPNYLGCLAVSGSGFEIVSQSWHSEEINPARGLKILKDKREVLAAYIQGSARCHKNQNGLV